MFKKANTVGQYFKWKNFEKLQNRNKLDFAFDKNKILVTNKAAGQNSGVLP